MTCRSSGWGSRLLRGLVAALIPPGERVRARSGKHAFHQQLPFAPSEGELPSGAVVRILLRLRGPDHDSEPCFARLLAGVPARLRLGTSCFGSTPRRLLGLLLGVVFRVGDRLASGDDVFGVLVILAIVRRTITRFAR